MVTILKEYAGKSSLGGGIQDVIIHVHFEEGSPYGVVVHEIEDALPLPREAGVNDVLSRFQRHQTEARGQPVDIRRIDPRCPTYVIR